MEGKLKVRPGENSVDSNNGVEKISIFDHTTRRTLKLMVTAAEDHNGCLWI